MIWKCKHIKQITWKIRKYTTKHQFNQRDVVHWQCPDLRPVLPPGTRYQFCHQVPGEWPGQEHAGCCVGERGTSSTQLQLRQVNFKFNFVNSNTNLLGSIQRRKKAGIQRLKFRCLFTRFCAFNFVLNMVSNHEKWGIIVIVRNVLHLKLHL